VVERLPSVVIRAAQALEEQGVQEFARGRRCQVDFNGRVRHFAGLELVTKSDFNLDVTRIDENLGVVVSFRGHRN
jgi:hypothetical protein